MTNVVCLLDGRLGRHQEQILEEFNPERLLFLQTTDRDLYSIGERLSDRFYIRHQVAPADADLTSYGADGLS